MSEPIELSEKNIQEIRNRLGQRAFLVSTPHLRIVVDTKHGRESYSVGDSVDLEQFEEKPEQEEVAPQDMSHEIKVYCDGRNRNVHAVRLYQDNMLMVRDWCEGSWCEEGVMNASYYGDWVVKSGENFYILADSSFRLKYKLWQPGQSFNDILDGTYERIGTDGRSFA